MTNISRGGNKQLANCWENWRNAQEALRDLLSKRLSFLNTSHLFSECTEFHPRVFAAVVPGKGEEGEALGCANTHTTLEKELEMGEVRAKEESWGWQRSSSQSSLRFTETDSEQTRSESIRKAMPAWETTRIAQSAVTHRQGNNSLPHAYVWKLFSRELFWW